jgi:alkanesulfonate monooxygenase SsuD/methylene tetrahydromethanopterin reductase-like flavin-dependent oxidoreductase (luciferase family)
MTGAVIGSDHPDANPNTWIVGSVEQVKRRLAEYEAAGVSGIYLQMQDHRDIEMVERIGSELA